MNVRNNPPGFLVIGAQKCGTTWLHRHLAAHPDLWMPDGKELEFFSYLPHLDAPGPDAYRAGFADAGDRLAGEATASYFWTHAPSPWCLQPDGFNPDVPGAVRRTLGGDVRLIVCLRDPVDRALSAWAHYALHGEVAPSLPFREAARYGGIVDMGFYGRHLGRWLAQFDRERLLILSLERDIVERPADTLTRIFHHLGVDDISPENETLEKPVFPGPERHRDTDGTVTIRLPDAGPVLRAEVADVAWLRRLYAEDAVTLERLAGPAFRYPLAGG